MGLEPFRLDLLGGVTLIEQLSYLCRFALLRRGIRGRGAISEDLRSGIATR